MNVQRANSPKQTAFNGRTFVAYYRVSTDRQGVSGLGLDAQRSTVAMHAATGHLIAEFQEIESGKSTNRPQLKAALDACRLHRATLVIARLDRLARDAAFILTLMNGDVEFIACDMPQANRMVLGILAVIAEGEREAISARTKAALQVAKSRGTRLGNPRWEESIEKARAARNGAAVPTAVVSQIRQCRTDGWPLRRIAGHLNEMGVRTPRGSKWHPETVRSALLKA